MGVCARIPLLAWLPKSLAPVVDCNLLDPIDSHMIRAYVGPTGRDAALIQPRLLKQLRAPDPGKPAPSLQSGKLRSFTSLTKTACPF